MLIKIGQIVGFHGFAGVDWVHDLADNHLYILELNPRPTPTYHLDRFSGVSFSRSLNQLLSGQRPVKPTEPVCEAGKLIRLFPQNLYWGISNRECRSFILCWQDAPWDDFFLLIAYLRRFLTHFLPKSWVQKVKSLIRKPA